MKVDVVIGAIGILILAHASNLTISYRGVLKLKGEEFSVAPPQVLAEVFLSTVLCFWAALTVPGAFLPIHPDSKENRGQRIRLLSSSLLLVQSQPSFLSLCMIAPMEGYGSISERP